MFTRSATGMQKLLCSFVKTSPSLSYSGMGRVSLEKGAIRASVFPDNACSVPVVTTARPFTISGAVGELLDNDNELRWRVLAFEKAALWSLTIRVGALMKRKVNPESVARTVRKYKTGR